MPKARMHGVNIYYEMTGEGFPMVWSHEFAGDYRSWEAQVRFFARRYKVITYNDRGYPPSDVPTEPDAYSVENSVEDLYQLLCHLKIEQAYVAGLSMGGGVALNFAIAHPEMVRALAIAGTGSGTVSREEWERAAIESARLLETQGMAPVLETYAQRPNRISLQRKDPRGWQDFCYQFLHHSGLGSALTTRGVQLKRRTIFELEPRLKALEVPTLIMVGDEDQPCLEPALFMKQTIPHSGLVVFPRSGHAINLEEPDAFNQAVLDFLTHVETGRW